MSEQYQGPKTWWSGDSAPEDKRNAQIGAIIGALVIAIVSPLTALSAILGYLSFARWRIYYTVLIQLAALSTVFFGITGLLHKSIMNYPNTIAKVVDAFADNEGSQAGTVISSIIAQAPISIPVGLWLAAVYSWWRWIRRNTWEDFSFRLTPMQYFRKQKNIRDLENDNVRVKAGDAALGIDEKGNLVVQSKQEAAAHTLLIGASGTGKTTTELMRARNYIKHGEGYVIIDLKGASDVPEVMADFARRYNRKFRHFLFQDQRAPYTGPAENGPSYYDPISRGDASRRKDMVINTRRWSEEHYKLIAESYLQTAFDVVIGSPRKDDKILDGIGEIIEVLDPGELSDRARYLPDEPYYDEIRDSVRRLTSRNLDKDETSSITGIVRQLSTMRSSTAGRWLRIHHDEGRNIDLRRVAEDGEIVVFSLDSLNYQEVSKSIANLIISDLKTVAGERGQRKDLLPLHVFIDEFSALDSDGLTGLINKSRSAMMPLTIATQVLADLKKIDSAFLGQLIGIVNSFIIHRSNTAEESEIFAGLVGKEMKWETSMGIEHTSGMLGSIGKGAATGSGRLTKKEDYIFSPSMFQELAPGEAIFIAKSPKNRYVKIQVIQENGGMTNSGIENSTPFEREPIRIEKEELTPVKTLDSHKIENLIEEILEDPTSEKTIEEHAEVEETFTPSVVKRASSELFGGRDIKSELSVIRPSQNSRQIEAPQQKDQERKTTAPVPQTSVPPRPSPLPKSLPIPVPAAAPQSQVPSKTKSTSIPQRPASLPKRPMFSQPITEKEPVTKKESQNVANRYTDNQWGND